MDTIDLDASTQPSHFHKLWRNKTIPAPRLASDFEVTPTKGEGNCGPITLLNMRHAECQYDYSLDEVNDIKAEVVDAIVSFVLNNDTDYMPLRYWIDMDLRETFDNDRDLTDEELQRARTVDLDLSLHSRGYPTLKSLFMALGSKAGFMKDYRAISIGVLPFFAELMQMNITVWVVDHNDVTDGPVFKVYQYFDLPAIFDVGTPNDGHILWSNLMEPLNKERECNHFELLRVRPIISEGPASGSSLEMLLQSPQGSDSEGTSAWQPNDAERHQPESGTCLEMQSPQDSESELGPMPATLAWQQVGTRQPSMLPVLQPLDPNFLPVGENPFAPLAHQFSRQARTTVLHCDGPSPDAPQLETRGARKNRLDLRALEASEKALELKRFEKLQKRRMRDQKRKLSKQSKENTDLEAEASTDPLLDPSATKRSVNRIRMQLKRKSQRVATPQVPPSSASERVAKSRERKRQRFAPGSDEDQARNRSIATAAAASRLAELQNMQSRANRLQVASNVLERLRTMQDEDADAMDVSDSTSIRNKQSFYEQRVEAATNHMSASNPAPPNRMQHSDTTASESATAEAAGLAAAEVMRRAAAEEEAAVEAEYQRLQDIGIATICDEAWAAFRRLPIEEQRRQEAAEEAGYAAAQVEIARLAALGVESEYQRLEAISSASITQEAWDAFLGLSIEEQNRQIAEEANLYAVAQEVQRVRLAALERQRASSSAAPRTDSEPPAAVGKDQYLHAADAAQFGPLHEQEWAKKNMLDFNAELHSYNTRWCRVCCHLWPVRDGKNGSEYTCSSCKRTSKADSETKKFSAENDMHPFAGLPVNSSALYSDVRVLLGLTQVEEMCIALATPLMRVYRLKGGQMASKGHVLNLPQDVTPLAQQLPRLGPEVSLVVLRREGDDGQHRDFRVRRDKVEAALRFLCTHNVHYKALGGMALIDTARIAALPTDGQLPGLHQLSVSDDEPEGGIGNDAGPVVDTPAPSRDTAASDADTAGDEETASFLPSAVAQGLIELATRQALDPRAPHSARPTQLPHTGTQGIPVVNWIAAGTPLNEFTTDGLAGKTFPTLFPTGAGDPTRKGRLVTVTNAEGFKHLMRYSPDGKTYPFAQHPRFPFWAQDMTERHRSLGQARFFLKQNPHEAEMSIAELVQMVSTSSAAGLMQKIGRYVSKITGSDSYWFARRRELEAVFASKGPGTIFFTLSAADNHWHDLHRLLPGGNFQQDDDQAEAKRRRKATLANAHLVDWWFGVRAELMVKHFFKGVLDAEWFWMRYEFQARGSNHGHGTAKLKNDPGLIDLTAKAYAGLKAKEEADKLRTLSIAEGRAVNQERLDALRVKQMEGAVAEARVLSYCDWLITTVSPQPIPESAEAESYYPQPHPSAQNREDRSEGSALASAYGLSDADYAECILAFQRHHCKGAYCLRKHRGDQKCACRFGCPWPLQGSTRLDFCELGNGGVRVNLLSVRNDGRVNAHCRLALQHWRANMDIQIILDQDAAMRYMVKYASKAEKKSGPAGDIMRAVMRGADEEVDNPQSKLRSIFLKAVGERDRGLPETARLLDGGKHVHCTFNFVSVSLTGQREIALQAVAAQRQAPDDAEREETATKPSMLDIYARRLDTKFVQVDPNSKSCARDKGRLPLMSLMAFAETFTVAAKQNGLWTLKLTTRETLAQFYPYASSDPDSPNYVRYCKYQLMIHKPWKEQSRTCWNGDPAALPASDEDEADMIVDAWKSFLEQNQHVQRMVQFSEGLADKLRQAREEAEGGGEDDEYDAEEPLSYDDAEPAEDADGDAFMFASTLCAGVRRDRGGGGDGPVIDIDPNVDWPAAHELSAQEVSKIKTWINDAKVSASGVLRQMEPFDFRNLVGKQRLAYDIVVDHHARISNLLDGGMSADSIEPLNMVVSGTAGTGKSCLIRALKCSLGDTVTLTATTGMAAFLICGSTVHRMLKLPVKSMGHRKLAGSALTELQERFTGVRYLIIDEMSMLSQQNLAWVDSRLRQATGKETCVFGGISVILVGDFGQLPPVQGQTIYATGGISQLAQEGELAYKSFKHAVVLTQVHRQQASSDPNQAHFKELLPRARDGQWQKKDWELLRTRFTSEVPVAEQERFKNAVRLYPTKDAVNLYNCEKLVEVGSSIAEIHAKHNVKSAKRGSADDASGLETGLFLCRGARVQLVTNLWQEAGLVNGARGTVVDIVYKAGCSTPDLPEGVLVQFDEYTGPSFRSDDPTYDRVVALAPQHASWRSGGSGATGTKELTRLQLPLRLCWATTIHKSQGQTLDMAIINLGDKEFSTGLTFVALSRLRRLADLLIYPMDFDRLDRIKNSKVLTARRAEDQRLKHISDSLAVLREDELL